MTDYNNNFLPNNEDLNTEEEPDILVDECKCSECNGTFFLELDELIDACPLCNSKFDCQET